MQALVIEGYDLGNTTYASDNQGPLSIKTVTERGFMDMNKLTTLTVINSSTGSSVNGTIDWKKKTMVIGDGAPQPLDTIKKKPEGSGMLSLTLEWSRQGKKYLFKSKNGSYTLRCGDQIVASFIPTKFHPFKKDEMAILNLKEGLSLEDMAFVSFAILWHVRHVER